MRETHRPDAGNVGPELELRTGLKFRFSSKVPKLIKLNDGLVAGALRGVAS